MPEEIGLFEAMRTMRAMRRLKPDPVPDELINRILQAGTWAPSGGDAQKWRFIVVKDPAIKKQIQVYYQRGLDAVLHRHAQEADPAQEARNERRNAAVRYLTEHFHEAPVLIVCCLYHDTGKNMQPEKMYGASIYPAVQNMLLAARGLGLGATLTARHLQFEREVDRILGLPANAETFAILPIGYPMGHFGSISRRPVAEVTFLDRWGRKYD